MENGGCDELRLNSIGGKLVEICRKVCVQTDLVVEFYTSCS